LVFHDLKDDFDRFRRQVSRAAFHFNPVATLFCEKFPQHCARVIHLCLFVNLLQGNSNTPISQPLHDFSGLDTLKTFVFDGSNHGTLHLSLCEDKRYCQQKYLHSALTCSFVTKMRPYSSKTLMTKTVTTAHLGGTFTLPGTSLTVHRMGYGAMQLAGPHVFGPPRDRDAAIAVRREALSAGVNHIDTSDFYGPHVTNQIIKEALHPYPAGLVIVTKLGARRLPDASWVPALSRQELIDGVHDNLRHLGLDVIDVVNLRVGAPMGPSEGSIEAPLTVLAELKQQGLIRHIGLSNITPSQFAEGSKITNVVCVQNLYNIARRGDDQFLDDLAAQGIPYVPYFPLGGFTPLQSEKLNQAAAALSATPMQVALAWLLQRSPNILLIPGTSSLTHLAENLGAASLQIPAEVLAKLE